MMAVAEEKVTLWFWKKFFPVVFFFNQRLGYRLYLKTSLVLSSQGISIVLCPLCLLLSHLSLLLSIQTWGSSFVLCLLL